MTSTSASVPAGAVEALRRTVRGAVAYPADPAYPSLLGRLDGRPSVVVEAVDERDVVAAVDVARQHGLALRTPTGPSADGPVLMVLTDRLDTVHVDAATHTAVAGAGADQARVVAAAAEHGLTVGPCRELRFVGPDGFVRTTTTSPPPGAIVTVRTLTLTLTPAPTP
jgi:FAD/FMN-containing dehydrogenase